MVCANVRIGTSMNVCAKYVTDSYFILLSSAPNVNGSGAFTNTGGDRIHAHVHTISPSVQCSCIKGKAYYKRHWKFGLYKEL